jgi:hypothetical protein
MGRCVDGRKQLLAKSWNNGDSQRSRSSRHGGKIVLGFNGGVGERV